jgi:hypothetical protein
VSGPENLIHQLVIGDTLAAAEIAQRAQGSDDVDFIVAAAVFAHSRALVARAATRAETTRERQLVAIAAAHLEGETNRVRDLAREHLADHPDSVLVAWISARSGPAVRMDQS